MYVDAFFVLLSLVLLLFSALTGDVISLIVLVFMLTAKGSGKF